MVERRTKTITKQKDQIEKQHRNIEIEKNKAEELLLNILPSETAEELKNKGKARTRQYRMVTVMFSDIKDLFSSIAISVTLQLILYEVAQTFVQIL